MKEDLRRELVLAHNDLRRDLAEAHTNLARKLKQEPHQSLSLAAQSFADSQKGVPLDVDSIGNATAEEGAASHPGKVVVTM